MWLAAYVDTKADVIIQNGKLVFPKLGIFNGDIFIKNGKIISISSSYNNSEGKKIIDASGLYVLPGIIDPHVHLGIFGNLEDEILHETSSALIGGVTTAGCFLYTDGSYFDYFPHFANKVEKYSSIDIFPHFCITTQDQIHEIQAYIEDLKITSFKIFTAGKFIPGFSDDRILDVFEKLKNYKDIILSIHTENPYIVDRATKLKMNIAKQGNLQDWSDCNPSLAEEEAVQKAVLFSRKYGVKIYLVHISAKESIDFLRNDRKIHENNHVYAETTSPYLTINTSSPLGARGKMVPPIRSEEDSKALWEGLRTGLIDTVGTDNTTITLEEKKVDKGIWEALPGYPTLATHLSSMLSFGVNEDMLDLVKLSEVMSMNPANIFGFYPRKGSLLPGSDADMVIIDLNKRVIVDPEKLRSRSDFSLFEGITLQGWPVYTLKSGKVLLENGEIKEETTSGRIINKYD